MASLKIDIRHPDVLPGKKGKLLSAPQLKAAIKKHNQEAIGDPILQDLVAAGDNADALEEILLHDWDEVGAKFLSSLAPTTLSFFIAGKASGDYHDNFTHFETFKAYCRLALTWPKFCYHNHLLQVFIVLIILSILAIKSIQRLASTYNI